jgi:putative GTP pyrophosphokinase
MVLHRQSLPNIELAADNIDAEFNTGVSAQERTIRIKEMILMMNLHNCAIHEVSARLEILNEDLQVRYAHNPIHHIESRLKSVKSIMDKLEKKGLPHTAEAAKNNITDIAGIRVICHYIDEVYAIADLLINQDDIRLVKKSDYIAIPKPSGYRSLHIIVNIPVFQASTKENVSVEVQFRTIAMDYWASLEHKLNYKAHSNMKEDLWKVLRQCAGEIHDIELKMGDLYKTIKELA